MILIIDNYDSFTYNVAQVVEGLYPHVEVIRNDRITIEEIEKKTPEAIIISPGPSYPSQAGISEDVIRHFAGKLPILGICLGHQAIGEVFGGKIVRGEEPMHGKSSQVKLDGTCPLFMGLPEVYLLQDIIPSSSAERIFLNHSQLPQKMRMVQ